MATRYNDDKPHRCPACHAVVTSGVKDARRLLTWAVVTCCRCGVEFTRWPFIARLLPRKGVVCDFHRPGGWA